VAVAHKRVLFEKSIGKFRLAQRDHKPTGISRLFRPITFSLKTHVAISAVASVLATAILIGMVSLVLVERGMREIISAQQLFLADAHRRRDRSTIFTPPNQPAIAIGRAVYRAVRQRHA